MTPSFDQSAKVEPVVKQETNIHQLQPAGLTGLANDLDLDTCKEDILFMAMDQLNTDIKNQSQMLSIPEGKIEPLKSYPENCHNVQSPSVSCYVIMS